MGEIAVDTGWTVERKSEADKLLENPRYTRVAEALGEIRSFYVSEAWDRNRMMEVQGELVEGLADMPDWNDEDIKAIGLLKQKIMGDVVFQKGFDNKENREGKQGPRMKIDTWWSGMVGEAVFLRAWSREISHLVSDSGELVRPTGHSRELDKKGIDFVSYVDYRNGVDDQIYRLYISFKTRSDMEVGDFDVAEVLDEGMDPDVKERYFDRKNKSPSELLDVVDRDFARYEHQEKEESRTLFVIMGRGTDDWKGMMRVGQDPQFQVALASKIDDILFMESGDSYYSENNDNHYKWYDDLMDSVEPVVHDDNYYDALDIKFGGSESKAKAKAEARAKYQ